MAAKTLAEKMKLKAGMAAGLVSAPAGCLKSLSQPKNVRVATRIAAGPFDWLQVFVRNSTELAAIAPRLPGALKPASTLWLSFPKGSSKIQTDLTRDHGWESLHGTTFKWITLISVDDTWSAFALRPYEPGGKQQSFR